MSTFLTVVYVVASIYVLAMIATFLTSVREYGGIAGIVEAPIVNKLTPILLLLCLVIAPVELYCDIVTRVPETTYKINGILEIEGDGNSYSVPMKVDYFVDVEYTSDDKHDYLFDGGDFMEVNAEGVFLVLDVTSPAKISVPNFIFEGIDYPETVESNKTYAVDVYGVYIDRYDRHGDPETTYGYADGTLKIPPLTRENLGISIEDQMASISIMGYAEHAVVFVLSAVCLLLYWWSRKARED